MKKIKKTALLSLTVLPSTFNVLSCSKANIDPNIKTGNLNNKGNKNNNDEEIKRMHAQINKIKSFLKEGIDGSKDFTPSQSLAEIKVQKQISEKIKELCGDPQNIKCIPQLKSQFFKTGSENYVDVEIICVKKDFQVSSMYYNLQIKNVKQDLQEVVDEALENLEDPIDFSKSFLIQHDDFNYDIIKNEFINVLNNQLEQEDERLSIKLVDRNQALLNNRKITIEVIGKDDNEEIKKIIQVTPIKLLTVNDYIDALVKSVPITRDDKLFADSIYTPNYWKTEVNNKIKVKFFHLNDKQLRRRQIESFKGLSVNPNIKFIKGLNHFPISIKLKYNKSFAKIDLILSYIENHPEFILNEVANHFKNNGLNLLNELIFDDSVFESNNIKNKIIEVMNREKKNLDEQDDIEIIIDSYNKYDKKYLINFSHKNAQIIDRSSLSVFKWVQLENIQKSPQQDLDDYLKNHLTFEDPIVIEPYYFDSINDNNLKEYDELIEHINNKVRNGISFAKLPIEGRQKIQLKPKEIISQDSNYIKIQYEFKFNRSGIIGSHIKNIIFKKQ